jgi:hypothetical protein
MRRTVTKALLALSAAGAALAAGAATPVEAYPYQCSTSKTTHSAAAYCASMDTSDGYRVRAYARSPYGHYSYFVGDWAVRGEWDGSYVSTGSWTVISVGIEKRECCFHSW